MFWYYLMMNTNIVKQIIFKKPAKIFFIADGIYEKQLVNCAITNTRLILRKEQIYFLPLINRAIITGSFTLYENHIKTDDTSPLRLCAKSALKILNSEMFQIPQKNNNEFIKIKLKYDILEWIPI